MKKKKSRKLVIFTTIFMLSLSHGMTIYAEDIHPNLPETTNQITTWVNSRVWKYKVINGKLYKRLYDKTACKWIGKWELVDYQ